MGADLHIKITNKEACFQQIRARWKKDRERKVLAPPCASGSSCGVPGTVVDTGVDTACCVGEPFRSKERNKRHARGETRQHAWMK